MIMLTGVEYDYTLPHQEAIHIVGVGMERASTPQENKQALLAPQAAIDTIRSLGGRAILAHPAWSLNDVTTIASLKDISAAEVYNSASVFPANGDRGDSSNILDVASAHGYALPMVASDDSHWYSFECCTSATWFNVAEASREGILEAMDAGRFFASRGPRFTQIHWDGKTLQVECTPVEKIIFYSNLPWVDGRAIGGANQVQAIYRTKPHEEFIRCQIVDAQGNSAWMSPIRIQG